MTKTTATLEPGHRATLYPETRDHGDPIITRTGRIRRGKREVHGPHWKHVMRVLGKDPERCHDMDTSAVRVIKSNSRQDKWECSRCKSELLLTPKKSAKLRMRPDAIWHRGCRGARLIEVNGAVSQVNKPAATTSAPAIVPKITMHFAGTLPPAPSLSGLSKIDKCKAIYQRNRHESRSMLIQMFVNAGCTANGAATYYATCKKLFG